MNSPDYYDVNDLLQPEERLIRDSVARWVQDRLQPGIGEHWQQGTFPVDLIPEMAELGLLGAHLPAAYGCAGATATSYGLIMQELERCDSGIRSFASVQGSLCMFPIFAFGSEEQRQRWLPPMARGEVIGCFGLTEPDSGSDPGGMMRTRAVPDGDGYRLNGSKMWITNGSLAHLAIIWARIAEEDGANTIRGFLVERHTPGFSSRPIKNKYSLRASDTSELILEDVHVPADAMLPGVRGLRGPLSCLDEARFGIAWGALGATAACYEEALAFAGERRSFGGTIASKQLVQDKLVRILSELTQGQLLCWRLGQLKEEGRVTPAQVSLAKRTCVQTALQTARTAREVLGASGITGEYQAMRHLCNLESVYTYEGTHDIHTLIVGHDITGERAF